MIHPAVSWLESLSPWPTDGFALTRMHELLDGLGLPQRAFPAIHVVGTNGKSTATRTIAELLRAEGLRVGAYTSPHVGAWEERLDTDPDTFARAVERIRPAAEAVGATQFEALTATGLAEFAASGLDAAVVEAGLGGRFDATNVLSARVVHLTNVGLEHTDVLGETRPEIAREKLAVAGPGAIVVLGEKEWQSLVPNHEVVFGGAREAAEAFLDRSVAAEVEVRLPGRFEWRGERELWDGAHNPDGARWLLERLPERDWVIVTSILVDKDADGMLAVLARAGRTLVATRSSSERALGVAELACRAAPFFDTVEPVDNPGAALHRARELAGERGSVLVAGSLYLLSDLSVPEQEPWPSPARA